MYKKIIDTPKKDLLKAYFDYDPTTGILKYKYSGSTHKKGDSVGYLHTSTNYLHVTLFGVNYLVHRLIYARHYGHKSLRDMEVNHINQNKTDNRLSNLVLTKAYDYKPNIATHTNNTSGVTGVQYCKRDNRWFATITVNKKRISLGGSKHKSVAIELRLSAEERFNIKNKQRRKLTTNK